MRRAAPLIALPLVLHAMPAEALLLRTLSDRVPSQGHVDAKLVGAYTPYELTFRNGTPFSFNPTSDGYHRFAMEATIEAGVAPETSLFMTLPVALTKHFDYTPLLTGLGNVVLGLGSRAISNDWFTWKSRIQAMFPTGTPSLGGGISGLGLDEVFTLSLPRRAVTLTLQTHYLYRLRTTQVDPATNLFTNSWNGQHAEVNAGIEWRVLRDLTLGVEALSRWDSPQEANRQGVPESGSTFVGVAPGFSLDMGPQVTFLGSVTIPWLRGGYQPSFRLEGTTGVLIRF